MTHIIIASLISLGIIAGCGLLRTAEDAAESTIEMNSKMEKMMETISDMNKKMDIMQEDMETMKGMKGDMTRMLTDMARMITFMDGMENTVEEMAEKMTSMKDQVGTVIGLMREMKTTTERMSGFMRTMLSRMEDMTSDMGEMLTMMHDVVRKGKQLGGFLGRSVAWSALNNPENQIEAKLFHATTYYYSLEHQNLAESDHKDADLVARSLLASMREFYRLLWPLAQGVQWKLDVTRKDNAINVLYAMSAAMHETNYHQTDYKTPPISMEDLVMYATALQIGRERGTLPQKFQGSGLATHNDEGILWHKLNVYLLQLRHNFITGAIVQKLSTIDENVIYGRRSLREAMAQIKTQGSWALHQDVLSNGSLMEEIALYIRISHKVRHFLHCRGLETKMLSTLKNAITKLKLDEDTQKTLLEIQDGQNNRHGALKFVEALFLLKNSVNGKFTQPCLDEGAFLKASPVPYAHPQSQ